MLRTSASGRLVGVDVARFLALAGMAATHIFPGVEPDGSLHPSAAVAAGRASALFAVVAGVSLALASGARSAPSGRGLWAARAGVLARAALLLALGMLLSQVDSPPLVILAYYAVLFGLMTPFLGLGARALAGWAVGAALVTPLASFWLRQYVDPAPIAEPGGPDLPVELLLTGTYPALTWTTYAFAGLAIGRCDLRRLGTALRLLVGGAAVAVAAKALSGVLLDAVGGPRRLRGWDGDVQVALAHGLFGTTPRQDWRWLVVSAPHSGTTLDLAHTVGTSAAVLGGCLLLVRLLPRTAVVPLAAAGSMTLTLYTAHVLALADGSPLLTDDRFTLWAAHVAVALVVATAWRSRLERGPLEALATGLDRGARGLVTGSAKRARTG